MDPYRPSGSNNDTEPLGTKTAIAGLALGMMLLGLIPVPTHRLLERGASAIEISSARSVFAALTALAFGFVIVVARALRGKALLTKDTSVVQVSCAAVGVGVIFFGSGYAYIAALQAGLHVAYVLLTVSAVAMVIARCLEVKPVSDRFVFGLTMALVTLSMILSTNVMVDLSIHTSVSVHGFLLAVVSGVAFGMLPRALALARGLDSTVLLAVGFSVSALAHLIIIAVLGGSLVIVPSILDKPELTNPDLAWSLFNGVACTYVPYAIANWAKRRGVTDSTMAVGYQLEPIVATMIAAPIIGQSVAPHVGTGVLFAVAGFLLFSLHEARNSRSTS